MTRTWKTIANGLTARLAFALLGFAVGCGTDPLATARDGAVSFFSSSVEKADPGWANLLGYLHRRFGTTVESTRGEPLHTVPDDQARPELAAIYRRLVDPRSHVAKITIAELPTPIDRITASALQGR